MEVRGEQGLSLPALAPSEVTNATAWQPAPQLPAHEPASAQGKPDRPRPWGRLGNIGSRRMRVLVAVAALALILAVILLPFIQRPVSAPVETPQPAIPGQMGEHFKELEESIRP